MHRFGGSVEDRNGTRSLQSHKHGKQFCVSGIASVYRVIGVSVYRYRISDRAKHYKCTFSVQFCSNTDTDPE